jgi:hypothetical protein
MRMAFCEALEVASALDEADTIRRLLAVVDDLRPGETAPFVRAQRARFSAQVAEHDASIAFASAEELFEALDSRGTRRRSRDAARRPAKRLRAARSDADAATTRHGGRRRTVAANRLARDESGGSRRRNVPCLGARSAPIWSVADCLQLETMRIKPVRRKTVRPILGKLLGLIEDHGIATTSPPVRLPDDGPARNQEREVMKARAQA